MPVDYYDEVANVRKMCQTCRLLLRWKGSVYKLLWKQVLFYFVTYIALGIIYKYALDPEAQRLFERIALYSAKYADSIPVVLMLGFFTGTVMQRWWAVYAAIPGTGKIVTLATFYMKRNNPEATACIRTLVRFVLLGWMLCMRNVCLPLKKKFPTLKSIQNAGLLLEHERQILERREEEPRGSQRISIYPLNWAMVLIREAKDQSYFESPQDSGKVLDALMVLKKSCSTVLKFQITSIPLSFIQAVTLTVHCFGIVSLMGRQFVDIPNKILVLDCFLPVLPALQYLAYLSWLKLAEVAVNPFGDDDDDFDVLTLYEKHLYMVDELFNLFHLNNDNPVPESVKNVNSTKFRLPGYAPPPYEEIKYIDDVTELTPLK